MFWYKDKSLQFTIKRKRLCFHVCSTKEKIKKLFVKDEMLKIFNNWIRISRIQLQCNILIFINDNFAKIIQKNKINREFSRTI